MAALLLLGMSWAAMPAVAAANPGDPAGPEPVARKGEPVVQGAAILDLQTVEQIAIANNPSLQAAEARVKQAIARVRQARSAWLPQLDLIAAATNTWLSDRDYYNAKRAASNPLWSQWVLGTQGRLQGQILSNVNQVLNAITNLLVPAGGQTTGFQLANSDSEIAQDFVNTSLQSWHARRRVDDSVENYSLSLVANWILFNGFDRKFSIAEARLGRQELEAAYQEAQRLLLAAVAQSYHAAQLARENVRIAEADQQFNERQLKEAKARRRVGTGSLSDELNFEVRVNAARSSLIQAHQEYRLALISLAELLAYPDAKFPADTELAPLAEESLEELNAPEAEALVAVAKATRPDLAQSAYAFERSEAGVGRSKAPFYPTVSVQASKNASRPDNRKFGERDFNTSVGVNVQYNLFAGGRNVAAVSEARAARTEAQRLLSQADLAVSSEVRQAIEQLKAAQEQVVLERANAVFVQRNRDLVAKEYAGGVGSLVRLNQAQRDLVSAEGNLALARVQLRHAWFTVRTATGETILPFTNESSPAGTADTPLK